MVTAEQLQGRTTPNQATSFSMDMLTQLSLFLAGCRGPASTVSKRNGGRWRGDTPWFQIGVYYNPSIVGHRTVGDHGPCRLESPPRCASLFATGESAKGLSGAPAKLASSEVIDERLFFSSTWQDISEMKRLVCAFPSTGSQKRPQSDRLLNLNLCLPARHLLDYFIL